MGIYYFQTNIVCLIVLLIIYLALRNRKDAMPARRVAFTRLLIIVAVICVSDVFAWYYIGSTSESARTTLFLSNMIYDGAITWAGYAWLNYVELRIKSFDYNHNRRKKLLAIPLIIMLILLVTDPFTNLVFSIDENGIYSREGGIVVHWIISWFYLVFATIEVVITVKKSSSAAERNQLVPMLWFIVPPAIAAILQMFLYGLTSTQCGMTLSVLIIAINSMAEEVMKDTLTGLNNRRALENSLIERLQKSNSKLTVLMCDIDKFKSINDTLGHTAGDLVLKRMADALKAVNDEKYSNWFLCRFGGDEFVFCGSDIGKDEISNLITDIHKSIEEANYDYSNNMKFSISVGEATGICSTYKDVEKLISLADAIMYEQKQAKANAK